MSVTRCLHCGLCEVSKISVIRNFSRAHQSAGATETEVAGSEVSSTNLQCSKQGYGSWWSGSIRSVGPKQGIHKVLAVPGSCRKTAMPHNQSGSGQSPPPTESNLLACFHSLLTRALAGGAEAPSLGYPFAEARITTPAAHGCHETGLDSGTRTCTRPAGSK